MQYLGSNPKWKILAFSVGMAAGVFAFHVVPAESVSEALETLPEAAVAAATIFAGTFVGILVWSSIGEWLKKRREPSALVCVGVGICLALALLGVYAIAIHNFLDGVFEGITTPNGEPSEVSSGWLHDVVFWLAISLWNSVGYGLAVSPSRRAETASTAKQPI